MTQLNYGPGDPVAVPAEHRVPLTGDSIAPRSSRLILTPAGTLAALTILLSEDALDGQDLEVTSTEQITALTITPATDDTVDDNAPSALGADSFFRLTYVKAERTWYLTSGIVEAAI